MTPRWRFLDPRDFAPSSFFVFVVCDPDGMPCGAPVPLLHSLGTRVPLLMVRSVAARIAAAGHYALLSSGEPEHRTMARTLPLLEPAKCWRLEREA